MDFGLQNKVVVITGAASGFGAAAVQALSNAGAKLMLCDINTEGAAKIKETSPAETHCFGLDVSDQNQVKAVISQIADQFGRIDTLLHFAGVIDVHGVEDTTPADWNRVIGINLWGTFLMVQAVAPVMRNQGGGRIVLTASDSARKGATVSGPAYAASKGGVIALTRDFAMKLGADKIVVNAVCPGVVMTPMVKRIGLPAQVLDDIRKRTPLGRLAEADDIAKVAIWLGSDAARFVNGEIVEVNGGFFFD